MDFNSLILLFSSMPELKIDSCIERALFYVKITPHSMTAVDESVRRPPSILFVRHFWSSRGPCRRRIRSKNSSRVYLFMILSTLKNRPWYSTPDILNCTSIGMSTIHADARQVLQKTIPSFDQCSTWSSTRAVQKVAKGCGLYCCDWNWGREVSTGMTTVYESVPLFMVVFQFSRWGWTTPCVLCRWWIRLDWGPSWRTPCRW